MNTLAWFLILIAMLAIRAVYKGRVAELPKDLSEMLLTALNGDFEGFKEVVSRSGSGLESPQAVNVDIGSANESGDSVSSASESGNDLLKEVRAISKGKRYVWGGTFVPGGSGGDCSGLVWRALKNLGIYSGARFTTGTFARASKSFAYVVDTPQAGDIVVWVRTFRDGHMGVATSPTRLFSAISSKRGIGDTSMTGFRGTRTVYRLGRKP